MRKLLLGSILVWGLFATAGLEELVSPGDHDPRIAPRTARDVILFDTRVGVDPPAFAIVSSAFTDAVLGGFETAGADDFTVPDCGWEVTRLRAYGNYSDPAMTGNTGPATSVNVYILPKTGTLPTSTDPASIAVWFGQNLPYTELDGVNGGDFEIEIPSLVLPGGDYWLIVQANIELLAVGQWNWTESSLTPNSGTTNGDESAWYQSAGGVTSPITGMTECVATWGQRVTTCSMTRNPDTNPPTDRDFAFDIEGNILVAGVTVAPTALTTSEDGAAATYDVVLDAPPTPGATVTITPASGDVTEGSVSAAINFTTANWDVPQTITVSPGASGDGNDGDVAYTITNAVATDGGGGSCYDGVTASDVSVTNSNIDGIATIIVDPSSGLTVSEDGTITQTVTISAGMDVVPGADVTVDLTNNTPGEATPDTASVVLTAGNGYSVDVVITGVADDVKEATQAFSITTESSVSVDAAYNGVNPSDISGSVIDTNATEVTVTPNQTPLQTTEAGGTDTVDYVLTAQPTADVTFAVSVNDPAEGSVSPTSLTFTNANWNTPQTVTVTGEDDDIDDGTVAYAVIAAPTTSTDPFWQGVSVNSASAENADDTDTAGFTVNDGGGVTTSETGTTDTFTVVLDSEPVFDVSIDVRSGDITEGLVSAGGAPDETVTLTFTSANWDTAQTVTVTGQDDDVRDDGDIVYTIFTENVSSGDPIYNAIADGSVDDVTATNTDEGDFPGITVTPASLTMDEDSPAMSFTVQLDSEPSSGTVSVPVTSNDTTEATVSPSSLTFTNGNWNVPQTVTVTPVLDFTIDGDVTFDVDAGPASGGNYTGLSASVSVTVNNIDTCGPMTLDAMIGESIIAYGTPTCVFDLYETGGSADPNDWAFLGTFTIGAGGSVDTGVIAQTDSLYVTTISGSFVVLTAVPAATVPTLGEWGMIAFITLLLGAGVVVSRRRLNA